MDELIKPETCAFAKKLGINIEQLRYPGFDLPTQTSMLKYLREEYGYVISPHYSGRWDYDPSGNYARINYYVNRTIYNVKGKADIIGCRKQLPTMEEAYEEGIRKVLVEIELLN